MLSSQILLAIRILRLAIAAIATTIAVVVAAVSRRLRSAIAAIVAAAVSGPSRSRIPFLLVMQLVMQLLKPPAAGFELYDVGLCDGIALLTLCRDVFEAPIFHGAGARRSS